MRIHSIYRGFIFFAVILGLLLACQKEEINRPFARVLTLPVTEVDSTGATFNAEVVDFNEEAIIDYGFIWTTYSQNVITLLPDRFSYRSLGANPDDKPFSVRISTGLAGNQTYYVRAYLRSNKGTVYGAEIVFFIGNLASPSIQKVFPELIVPNDTLLIQGNYFSGIKSAGKVIIGVTEAEIVSSTITEVRCIVPFAISSNSTIVIQNEFGQKTAPVPVPTIGVPQLDRITPLNPAVGDTVTIEGSNFSTRPEWNIIRMDTYSNEVVAVKATRNRVQFVLPYMTIGATPINIFVRFYDERSNILTFGLAAPVIEDFFPKTVSYGDTLTIVGRNFSPGGVGNKLYYAGGDLRVLEGSSKILKVYIPEIPFGNDMDLSEPIDLEALGYFISSQARLKYVNKDWKIVKNLPERFPYDPFGFVLQNKIYYNNNHSRDWWTYNVATNNWEIIAQAQIGRAGDVFNRLAIGIGDEAFIIQNDIYSQDSVQFVRFRPSNNQQIKVPSLKLPAGTSQNAPLAAFAIDRQIFMCFSSRTEMCWRFDMQTGRWSRSSDFSDVFGNNSEAIQSLAALTLNQKGYLLARSGSDNFVLEYNPVSNAWKKVGDFPNNIYPDVNTSFVYGGKGYFVSLAQSYSQAFEWNPTLNQGRQWVMATPPDNNYDFTGQSFTLADRVLFAINGKLYQWFPR